MDTHLIDAFNVLESINKAMGDWIESSIVSHNLAVLDFRILDSLAQGNAATMDQCARHLNITPSKISLSVEKLEKVGYVQRRRDRPDRRMVFLQLSDEGLEIYELALSTLNERWRNVLSNVGTDVKRMAALFAGPTLTPVGDLVKNLLRERSSTV
ncbi:transcriptional regulator, SarA/Rot family [Pseudomonas baetica]|uniref:transcriptional regulator, SarA/Rot family n=1 Tax=Pseudomonas baetica TaxID=674054 RepID=UPI002404D5E2|nr:MarR family transcriptional regulator [Pseudomonas baetica]MDF9773208.1 DNA-binding MarR family transcriptional regulator [Pseudomonas baetica]